MNQLIFFDGRVIEKKNLTIDPFSPSLLYGMTVFEGIRYYYDKEINRMIGFRLLDHFLRFKKSLNLLQINYEISFDYFLKSIENTLVANKLNEDTYVRVTLILDGDSSWSGNGIPKLMVTAIPRRSLVNLNELLIRVSVTNWIRISDSQMPPRIKVGANYINSRMALLDSKSKGFDNAIFLNLHGKVAEGTGACVFIVRNNQLITPSLDQSILESITRDTLINIALDMGIVVIQRAIDKTELYISEEVFFVGTAAEITPIIQIDSFIIGNAQAGPMTTNLHMAFLEIVNAKKSKFKDWNTIVSIT